MPAPKTGTAAKNVRPVPIFPVATPAPIEPAAPNNKPVPANVLFAVDLCIDLDLQKFDNTLIYLDRI